MGFALVVERRGYSLVAVLRLLIEVASLVAVHGHMWASVVVAHRLSCPLACGIFPDQGLNMCPLHWQADSYPLYHQGSLFLYMGLVRRGPDGLESLDLRSEVLVLRAAACVGR